jgi:general secretion pathway protein M
MGLREQLTNMSPREQRLLGLLGIVFGLIVLLGGPIYVFSTLSSARDRNDQIREALRQMDRGRELFAKRRGEKATLALRYAKPAPPLASFIESAARDNGLDVPESTDRPDVVGKGYTERVTVVKMKAVNLKPLVKMLEKIERSGHPVAITMLDIKARATGPDIYDVSLGVSAYDKQQKAPEAKTPEDGAKPKAPKVKGQEL